MYHVIRFFYRLCIFIILVFLYEILHFCISGIELNLYIILRYIFSFKFLLDFLFYGNFVPFIINLLITLLKK